MVLLSCGEKKAVPLVRPSIETLPGEKLSAGITISAPVQDTSDSRLFVPEKIAMLNCLNCGFIIKLLFYTDQDDPQ